MRPSLDGVQSKIDRAKFHSEEFAREWSLRQNADIYEFAGEIHRQGFDHVYRSVDPPAPSPDWPLMIGDCVHNLRSAVDHLAWQLVRLNGGGPTTATQFPIRTSIFRRSPCTGLIEPTPLLVSGGVSQDAMDIIDSVQPYKRRDEARTHPLWLIHELDAIDKHRHLVLSVVAVRMAGFSWSGSGNDFESPIKRFVMTRKPLEHNQVVAKVVWREPRDQLNGNLNFTPWVLFGERSPKAVVGENVMAVLAKLTYFVEDELVSLFRPLFPE